MAISSQTNLKCQHMMPYYRGPRHSEYSVVIRFVQARWRDIEQIKKQVQIYVPSERLARGRSSSYSRHKR